MCVQVTGSQPGLLCTPPPGDIWQCFELFLVVPTGGEVPWSFSWVEARDAARHSAKHRTAPTTTNVLSPNVNNSAAMRNRGSKTSRAPGSLSFWKVLTASDSVSQGCRNGVHSSQTGRPCEEWDLTHCFLVTHVSKARTR